ncbi:Agamous-like MADS-box protein AGL90 [Hibiscus syriacus]|uniref:Agamous-like MADS-box protein AGL90 n=1 Tax=Hibiscus syriacus TaxID=106335 RepID=A0A6A3CTT5_HIBSY|nr:Agamous-like MADS-box protein AGL90 [Hibiscus syriacus]
MTRKKVKLAYINNDSARKATFKKRKKGLMKKVSELSTLCGIDACAIMYSPYESQPEVWPSPMGVQRVLSKFRKIPEMEQSKKMVNQETFLGQRITKAKPDRKSRLPRVKHDGFERSRVVDRSKPQGINKRVDLLSKASHNPQGSSVDTTPSVMTTVMPEATPEKVQVEANNNVDLMQRQHWIMELMNNNNPKSHVGFGGDEMMFPFGDNININNNALWFPWER